jgi:hypothetical protein
MICKKCLCHLCSQNQWQHSINKNRQNSIGGITLYFFCEEGNGPKMQIALCIFLVFWVQQKHFIAKESRKGLATWELTIGGAQRI